MHNRPRKTLPWLNAPILRIYCVLRGFTYLMRFHTFLFTAGLSTVTGSVGKLHELWAPAVERLISSDPELQKAINQSYRIANSRQKEHINRVLNDMDDVVTRLGHERKPEVWNELFERSSELRSELDSLLSSVRKVSELSVPRKPMKKSAVVGGGSPAHPSIQQSHTRRSDAVLGSSVAAPVSVLGSRNVDSEVSGLLNVDKGIKEGLNKALARCTKTQEGELQKKISQLAHLAHETTRASDPELVFHVVEESSRLRSEIIEMISRILTERPNEEVQAMQKSRIGAQQSHTSAKSLIDPDIPPSIWKDPIAQVPSRVAVLQNDGIVEPVGIDLGLSERCLSENFRDRADKLFENVKSLKNPKISEENQGPLPPSPKPLELMSDEEQVAYIDSINRGSVYSEATVTKHARAGWLGIRNMGNTCYLSAVLQLLMHAKPFRSFFFSENERSASRRLLESENYVTSSMTKLVQQMWFEASLYEGEPLTPTDLLCAIHQKQAADGNEFVIGRQSDAHEALHILLRNLDESGIDIGGLLWNQATSTRSCSKCGRQSRPSVAGTYELMLAIPPVVGGARVTLEECFSSWRKTPVQDFGCCDGSGGAAFETSQLTSTGNLLLIELGRFKGLHEKVHTIVEIPSVLDLQVAEDEKIYRLIGIVNHNGRNRLSGHYTAMVYHDLDNTWLNANDREITRMVAPERIRSSEAFLILYELIY